MKSIPTTKLKNIGTRSMTSSEDQNEFERSVLSDLLSLYNKANLMEIELDNAREVVEVESSYMKLSAIKTQTMMAHFIENFLNETNLKKTITLFPDSFQSIETNPVKIDLETFDVTLNSTHKESKVNIYDELSEETFVPDSLKVELLSNTNDDPNIVEIVDNDVYRCFDKKTDSSWIRRIKTNNNVSEVTTVMNIYLPDDTVTTDLVNEIVIKPFPVNAVDIKEIKYSSTYDVSYTTVLNELEQYEKNTIKDYVSYLGSDYEESFNLRLNFNEKVIKVLTISFSQKNYIQEGSQRIFYIGAKEIEINYNKFAKEFGEFECIATFKDSSSKKITEIKTTFNNPNITDESSIEQILFEVDDTGQEFLIEESIPFITNAKRIKIKNKINLSVSENTPNISKINLFYENI